MDNKSLTTWERIKDSDIYHSFIKSPTAIASSTILFIIFFCSFFVELITTYDSQTASFSAPFGNKASAEFIASLTSAIVLALSQPNSNSIATPA